MDDVKRHFSICSCTSPEHTVQWSYTPAHRIKHKDTEVATIEWPSEVYFDVCVSWRPSFFKRCWKAIQYIFGHRSVYGHFDTFVLEKPAAKQLVAFLQDYINEPDLA